MNNKLSNYELDCQATVFEVTGSPTFAAVFREALAYREAESKQKPVGFGIMLVNGGVIQTHEVYITEQSAINAIDNILSAKPRAHETFIPVPLYTSPVLSQPVSDDSNPVAEIVSKHGDPEAFGERELQVIADIRKMPYGTKLYASPVLGQNPVLTAAAPELLEALQALSSDLNPVPLTTVSKMYANVTVANVIRARSAIAKATGEIE